MLDRPNAAVGAVLAPARPTTVSRPPPYRLPESCGSRLSGKRSRARSEACSVGESGSAGPFAGRHEPGDRQAPHARTVGTGVYPSSCQRGLCAGRPRWPESRTARRVSRLARCVTDVVCGGEICIRGSWCGEAGAVVVTPCVPESGHAKQRPPRCRGGSLLRRRQRSNAVVSRTYGSSDPSSSLPVPITVLVVVQARRASSRPSLGAWAGLATSSLN